jgi:type III restriction enzyme
VVEYNGKDRKNNIDTNEKKLIGEVWEAKSGGACIFRLVSKDDYDPVLRAEISPCSGTATSFR